jgi:hypothetical protein
MFLGIPLTPFNIINFLVLALTAWVGMVRYTRGPEANLPLLYWISLIGHMRVFEGGFDDRWILAGTALCCLIRFEFMKRQIVIFVQLLESAVMGYVVWRTVGLILLW